LIQINDFISEHLQSSVMITGFPRGGTTIVGKLIGTFSNVEYAFEPPLMTYLDANLRTNSMDKESILKTLKTYLYYDYFANYIHGRNYNFRPEDDSSILGMKPFAEIFKKWSEIDNVQDARKSQDDTGFVFAFKFPGIYNLAGALFAKIPKLKIIDITRNPDRVLASMMAKGWFWDENLTDKKATGLWPFHPSNGKCMVPYLVKKEDIDKWQKMNNASRTVYICNRLTEDKLNFQAEVKSNKNYFNLEFESFLQKPEEILEELLDFLNLERGEMTPVVLDEIAATSPPSDIEKILNACDQKIENEYIKLKQNFKNSCQ
jgi:hypothetical protein